MRHFFNQPEFWVVRGFVSGLVWLALFLIVYGIVKAASWAFA